jgi:hypothetical protein
MQERIPFRAADVDRHVDLVRSMEEAGHLARVHLSHDAGWYHVGEPGGGSFRPCGRPGCPGPRSAG